MQWQKNIFVVQFIQKAQFCRLFLICSHQVTWSPLYTEAGLDHLIYLIVTYVHLYRRSKRLSQSEWHIGISYTL